MWFSCRRKIEPQIARQWPLSFSRRVLKCALAHLLYVKYPRREKVRWIKSEYDTRIDDYSIVNSNFVILLYITRRYPYVRVLEHFICTKYASHSAPLVRVEAQIETQCTSTHSTQWWRQAAAAAAKVEWVLWRRSRLWRGARRYCTDQRCDRVYTKLVDIVYRVSCIVYRVYTYIHEIL